MYTGFWWGNLREKRPLEITRRRWDDNIEMDLQEVLLDATDWIDLAKVMDRWRELSNAIMNLRVP